MPTFVIQKQCGIAVVNADGPREALEMLKAYEGDEYLSHGITPDNIRLISSEERGVMAYHAD